MSDEIRVNTDALRGYAGQLSSIQNKIYALNSEIRTFRYHTGKLWNVNSYGYEWTINAAKSYLYDTAAEFESIERYLQGCNPEMYEGNTGWFSAVNKEYPTNSNYTYEKTKEYVDRVLSVVSGSIALASGGVKTKFKTKQPKIIDLVKGLAGKIPIVGGVIDLADDMNNDNWMDETTLSGKVASFNSGLLKVGSGILSIAKDASELVDNQIEAIDRGFCTSTRWRNAIFGVKETVRGLNGVQKFQYGVRTTFSKEFTKMFKPEKTVLGKVECVAKWADVAADYLGYYKDDKDKYGTWGGVVASVGKTALKQSWKAGVKAGVAGVLALTPIGGSALAVGVAATVVSWGADYAVNKLSDGEYKDVGDFISKNVDDGVDAIVDTYKVAKKVASKGVEAAKGIVKNAKKSVANWWKDTKSSLSFAF